MERQSAVPVRGLMRSAAIRQAGLVRSDEFRAVQEIFVWLAKLLRWGDFSRVAQPLYYRLDHADNYHKRVMDGWLEDRRRAAATTLFTGLLEAATPLCRTSAERLFVQQFILDQIVLFHRGDQSNSSGKFIADCLERLRYEGNIRLLGEDLPIVLQKMQGRQDEIDLLKRSRIRRFIYRIRQRTRMATLIYPMSGTRRVIYQIRHLLGIFRNKLNGLLVPG